MPVSVKNISVAHTKPTLIFKIRDWLDQDRFEKLAESFPPSDKAQEEQNKKLTFNVECDGFQKFLKTNPPWREFHEDMINPRLLHELNDIYNDYHGRDEKWIIGRNYIFNLINKFIFSKNLVELKLTFSYLPKGAFIVPHTDAPKKLVSLMLYFPSSNNKLTKQNGTKFWRFKSENSKNYLNWENKKFAPDSYSAFYADAECFYETEFVKNRLYGFLKTDLSWHSVDRIEVPKGDSRNSINININKIDALGSVTKNARKLPARMRAFATSGLAYVKRSVSN